MGKILTRGILGRRYNETLHGRSVNRRADVPGHNVIIGYGQPGLGDGVDVFENSHMEAFAPFEGTVVRIAERDGRLGLVQIANGKKGLVIAIAHLHVANSLQVGGKVKEGSIIGWVSTKLTDPHAHLELWVHGRSISHPVPKCLACTMDEILRGV